jgi:tetraacyldisaccharide 4'-kinase
MLDLLSHVYGFGARLRNAAYDRGFFSSHALGPRTISIGNLTTGGTGKTPIVAAVAKLLAEQGERVCILSRGYGRKHPARRVLVSDGTTVLAGAAEGGDEPVELGRRLIGSKVVVLADADRVSAAGWAIDKFGITAFVLDDAFQHRRAKRDCDIVCIDATREFVNEKLLPAGMMREQIAGLRRADAVILTRSELADDLHALRTEVEALAPTASIFTSTTRLSRVTPLKDFLDGGKVAGPAELARTRPLFAFCGLGNSRIFFRQLEREALSVVGTKSFPDHHYYSQKDADDLARAASAGRSAGFVTTAKDAVKLEALDFGLPCWVAEIEVDIDPGQEFHKLILSSS